MAKIQSSVPVMLNEAKYLAVLRFFGLRRVIGVLGILVIVCVGYLSFAGVSSPSPLKDSYCAFSQLEEIFQLTVHTSFPISQLPGEVAIVKAPLGETVLEWKSGMTKAKLFQYPRLKPSKSPIVPEELGEASVHITDHTITFTWQSDLTPGAKRPLVRFLHVLQEQGQEQEINRKRQHQPFLKVRWGEASVLLPASSSAGNQDAPKKEWSTEAIRFYKLENGQCRLLVKFDAIPPVGPEWWTLETYFTAPDRKGIFNTALVYSYSASTYSSRLPLDPGQAGLIDNPRDSFLLGLAKVSVEGNTLQLEYDAQLAGDIGPDLFVVRLLRDKSGKVPKRDEQRWRLTIINPMLFNVQIPMPPFPG